MQKVIQIKKRKRIKANEANGVQDTYIPSEKDQQAIDVLRYSIKMEYQKL